MKLTGNNEWIAIGALIVYIAFTPGFPIVRQLLSSEIGKVLGLGLVIYVWKYVSEPVALLLLVNFIRCASMRERLTMPNAHCPSPYTLSDDNECKDTSGKSGPPPSICLEGQTWNGTECTGASASTSVGSTSTPAVGPTGNTVGSATSATSGSTGNSAFPVPPTVSRSGIEVFTNAGGVQPNSGRKTAGFAPA